MNILLKTINKLNVIIVLIISTLQAFSQEDSTIKISLDDAIKKVIEQNYDIEISKKENEINTNNNTWARAGSYPKIITGINQINRYDNTENQISGDRDKTKMMTLSPFVQFQMVLFNGFAIKYTKSNLEHFENMSEIEYETQIENTVTDLIEAYYTVILESEKLEVSKQLMTLSKDRYNYVKEKKELGLAGTFDLLQVENAFVSDSSEYLLREIYYKNSIRKLKTIFSDTTEYRYELTDSLNPIIENYNVSDLEKLMYLNNKIINTLNEGLQISENNIKIAQSAKYPSLLLNSGADYSNKRIKYNDMSAQNGYSTDVYANFVLNYTLFDGGNRKKSIQNKQIELEKSELEINNYTLNLRTTLYSISDMYEQQKQMLNLSMLNLKSAKLNLEIAEDKFKSGTINSFNYRDIQMLYLKSAYSALQAKYNLILTRADILKLTGTTVK